MDLNNASQLGTVDDVTYLIDIFTAIMSAVLPVLGLLLVIYVARKIYKRHKEKEQLRQKQKEISKQNKEQTKQIKKQAVNLSKQQRYQRDLILNNDSSLAHKLDDVQDKPYDRAYDNLALEFGEDGKIIR